MVLRLSDIHLEIFIGLLAWKLCYSLYCTHPTDSNLLPADYPFYYNWSSDAKAFQKGYCQLPSSSRYFLPGFNSSNWEPKERWGSHSASQQDLAVIDLLKDKSNGFFVDLAANQWKKGSNSYLLETFNHWKGICIEPNDLYFQELLGMRRCQLFINPVGKKIGEEIIFRFNGVFSGIAGDEFDQKLDPDEAKNLKSGYSRPLLTVTLTTILDFYQAPRRLDYLSLDVEGAEFQVMSGLDHQRYIFSVLTVERPKTKLHLFLAKNGYLFLRLLTDFPGDALYVHHSIEDLSVLWPKHFRKHAIIWKGQEQHHLLRPSWGGNVSDYIHQAEALYHEHINQHNQHKVRLPSR